MLRHKHYSDIGHRNVWYLWDRTTLFEQLLPGEPRSSRMTFVNMEFITNGIVKDISMETAGYPLRDDGTFEDRLYAICVNDKFLGHKMKKERSGVKTFAPRKIDRNYSTFYLSYYDQEKQCFIYKDEWKLGNVQSSIYDQELIAKLNKITDGTLDGKTTIEVLYL